MDIHANRSLLWAITLLAVCTGFAFARFAAAQGMSGATKKPPAPPVVVAEVTRAQLQAKLWYSGSIESRDEASLAAESDGRVVAVAEVGDRLARGAPVVRLDDTLLKQERNAQRAEVDSQRARIYFLERETERLRKLTRSNNAALSRYEETRSDLQVAQAMRAAAVARARHTEELIRRMTIVAPSTGVLKARRVEAGEWVKRGDVVADLVGTERLEVRVGVAAKALGYVAEGDTLTVKVEDRMHPARLRAVVGAASDETRLFELRLDVSNGAGLPGELARVAVPVSSERDALLVPEDALVIRSSGIGVFVVGGDMVARRVEVRVGVSSQARVEVVGDLQEGQKVVVRGGERLRDGMQVRFVDGAAAPGTRDADEPLKRG